MFLWCSLLQIVSTIRMIFDVMKQEFVYVGLEAWWSLKSIFDMVSYYYTKIDDGEVRYIPFTHEYYKNFL